MSPRRLSTLWPRRRSVIRRLPLSPPKRTPPPEPRRWRTADERAPTTEFALGTDEFDVVTADTPDGPDLVLRRRSSTPVLLRHRTLEPDACPPEPAPAPDDPVRPEGAVPAPHDPGSEPVLQGAERAPERARSTAIPLVPMVVAILLALAHVVAAGYLELFVASANSRARPVASDRPSGGHIVDAPSLGTSPPSRR